MVQPLANYFTSQIQWRQDTLADKEATRESLTPLEQTSVRLRFAGLLALKQPESFSTQQTPESQRMLSGIKVLTLGLYAGKRIAVIDLIFGYFFYDPNNFRSTSTELTQYHAKAFSVFYDSIFSVSNNTGDIDAVQKESLNERLTKMHQHLQTLPKGENTDSVMASAMVAIETFQTSLTDFSKLFPMLLRPVDKYETYTTSVLDGITAEQLILLRNCMHALRVSINFFRCSKTKKLPSSLNNLAQLAVAQQEMQELLANERELRKNHFANRHTERDVETLRKILKRISTLCLDLQRYCGEVRTIIDGIKEVKKSQVERQNQEDELRSFGRDLGNIMLCFRKLHQSYVGVQLKKVSLLQDFDTSFQKACPHSQTRSCHIRGVELLIVTVLKFLLRIGDPAAKCFLSSEQVRAINEYFIGASNNPKNTLSKCLGLISSSSKNEISLPAVAQQVPNLNDFLVLMSVPLFPFLKFPSGREDKVDDVALQFFNDSLLPITVKFLLSNPWELIKVLRKLEEKYDAINQFVDSSYIFFSSLGTALKATLRSQKDVYAMAIKLHVLFQNLLPPVRASIEPIAAMNDPLIIQFLDDFQGDLRFIEENLLFSLLELGKREWVKAPLDIDILRLQLIDTLDKLAPEFTTLEE